MDFGTLLHAAQKNGKGLKKEPIRCYSTKFEPPKKEQRSKELSENIKRFLAKKEVEDKQKQREVARKKDELLALRALDKKSSRRVNVMLKRTKSANQSVMQDAINMSSCDAGPAQPDEDDYGYVSQEAAAFYNKMMEKYSKTTDEPKFSSNKRKSTGNLNATRDRVKAALELEREDANQPHKRKRKPREDDGDEPVTVTKPKPRPPPPPMNFNDLLKLAEKKQFEPVVIEQKPKEEEKKPLTKKQKQELEKEKEWLDRKEGRLPPLFTKPPPIKIPKLVQSPARNGPKPNEVDRIPKRPLPKASNKSEGLKNLQSREKIPTDNRYRPESVQRTLNHAPSYKPTPIDTLNAKNREVLAKSKPKEGFTKKTAQNRQNLVQREQLKPKQFPPPDVRRREYPPGDVKRKPIVNKRRILDDDDDEYDSEMDDFLDDGPEEDEDYSKHISEIFGYDKSKYRNLDDDVDDMESTFAQQMREEVRSARIGIMEDLEDMKKEEEEKKRKQMRKLKL